MRWDHWLEMVVPNARILQEDLPTLFVDYRKDCVPDGPPAGAAVVCFPRSPKPHEVVDSVPWVKRHWC